MAIVDKKIKETFKSSICNKKLGPKGVFLQHIKVVHEKIKNFECSICTKKFGYNIHLQRHIKSVPKKSRILNAAFAINIMDRIVFFCDT